MLNAKSPDWMHNKAVLKNLTRAYHAMILACPTAERWLIPKKAKSWNGAKKKTLKCSALETTYVNYYLESNGFSFQF